MGDPTSQISIPLGRVSDISDDPTGASAIIVVALFLVLAAAIMTLVGRSIRRRASGNLELKSLEGTAT